MGVEVHLNKIGQIALPVSDLEMAITFYRDTLGIKFLFQAPPGLAFFDCDGIRLLLDVPAGQQSDRKSSIIYFNVDDIQEIYQALLHKNVEFTAGPSLIAKMPDHELWMAFFNDPDKNTLALMSEVR